MNEMAESLSIPSFDKNHFDAFLYAPPLTPAPGIVMIPEIFGVNAPLREIAARYASEGFVVLVLDIFWRLKRGVDLGYDKTSYKEAFELHAAFDYPTAMKDVQSAITALRARKECNGHVGLVGFCLGGTIAYLAASRTDSEASVGYYGTRIQNFLSDGPRISRPLMLHFGERDHTTPPELLVNILDSVKDNPSVSSYVYPDVGHAFANHHRADTYHEATTRLADGRTFAFFRKCLA